MESVITDEHPGRYVDEKPGESELGRGGIGRVFIARDRHLRREVAIKELLSHDDGDEAGSATATARFLREARITGQLDHPNIVPIYELGRRADGSLYYTMRVVRGRTLSRAIVEAGDLPRRLALVTHFLGLCQAIAYAHSRGIVHRDIKPENVMIGEFGETVVLDWGMAKGCRGRTACEVEPESVLPTAQLTAAAHLTVEGTLCGTPTYMSPEQAMGRVSEIDERSDVWSLGAVLYTVLTGRPPFQGKQPLEVITSVLTGNYVRPREVDPRIPPDLAAIAERALRLDRGERYANGKELARDVQAYVAGQQVGAYSYSSFELLSRFVERHRAAVIASAVGIAVAVALVIVSYGRVLAARDRALLAERKALENERSARENEKLARHSSADVLTEKARPLLAEGDVAGAAELAERALELEERPDARGLLLAARSSPISRVELERKDLAGCERSAFTFSGRRLACAKSGRLALYELGNHGEQAFRELSSDVLALAWSSDGQRLASVLRDGTVTVDLATKFAEPLFVRRVQGATALALSSDGRFLACGTARRKVLLFEVGGAPHARELDTSQPVSALAFETASTRLAVGGELGSVTLWTPEAGEHLAFAGHSGTVLALAFADGGRRLASGGADRSVRIWNVGDQKPATSPITADATVTSLGFSRDGRFLAFGGKDKSFTIYDLKDANRGTRLRQRDETAELVVASADADELVTLGKDRGLKLWSLASLRTPGRLFERGNVLALSLVPGQGTLVSGGVGQNGLCIFSLGSGACATRLPADLAQVRSLAISPDGARLAVAGSDRRVFLWDLATRLPERVLDTGSDELRSLAFSGDGRRLVAGGLSGKLFVADVASGERVAELDAGAPVQTLRFAARTSWFVSGDRKGMLQLWDIERARRVDGWAAHGHWVLAVAVRRDGSMIASAGDDGNVKLWNTATRRLVRTLAGHHGKVLATDLSPDGVLLASAGEDKTVRIWQVNSGRCVAVLPAHDGAVRTLEFSSDGALLASGGDDGLIRLWPIQKLGAHE